ncbi:uncharacterized protein VDAG_08594 [Verticillium dahliae VdLs.17]|uniref:Uncharacterized protein n=1 Tax=Verticillium dahliae (strain VdLs.17 / ATCC MYA-4575 / FGSC 10137) TaxID=498257 RepID=G2XEK9_VERDV|nr:uncharacterized protein VDAG_08594 [Verticillium dahliae VdLs.17]EGY18260.1 hypothetical protein VDAG_08594 [Verticillium dahliae VdLs.17]
MRSACMNHPFPQKSFESFTEQSLVQQQAKLHCAYACEGWEMFKEQAGAVGKQSG